MYIRAIFLALASPFLAGVICAQTVAPLGLEWGMRRQTASSRLELQNAIACGSDADSQTFEGVRLGEFESCRIVLFFARKELAIVKIESPARGNWVDRISRLSLLFSKNHGPPLGDEITSATLRTGLERTWMVADATGEPVNITLEANNDGLTLTYLDVLRTTGIAIRAPELTLGMNLK